MERQNPVIFKDAHFDGDGENYITNISETLFTGTVYTNIAPDGFLNADVTVTSKPDIKYLNSQAESSGSGEKITPGKNIRNENSKTGEGKRQKSRV